MCDLDTGYWMPVDGHFDALDDPVSLTFRYLVTHLMGADLNNIIKMQKLTDDHVQFLIYQILRGLKVKTIFYAALVYARSYAALR